MYYTPYTLESPVKIIIELPVTKKKTKKQSHINKLHYTALLSSLHLNLHILRFHPQTQTLKHQPAPQESTVQ